MQDAPDTVNILAILGDDVTPAALQREAGMRAAADRDPDVEIVRSFSVLWDSKAAYDRVHTALNLIEVDGIWAANDDIAIAAMRAVEDCGSPCQDIEIVGLNWSEAGLDAVARGDLLSSHGGHFLAGGIALAHITRGALDQQQRELTLSLRAITDANIEALPRTIREREWAQLNFNALAQQMAQGTPDELVGEGVELTSN